MRIVFTTPVVPGLSRPRPHYFLRGLAERGHEVHLVVQVPGRRHVEDLDQSPGWSEIAQRCASTSAIPVTRARSAVSCAMSLPGRVPLRVAYARSDVFVRTVHELATRVRADVIHVDRERLAPWLRELGWPKVLDAADAISPFLDEVRRVGTLPSRVVASLDRWKMPAFEARMAEGYRSVLVTTEDERRKLRALGMTDPIEVVPNGVDERYLRARRRPDGSTLVFTGTMSYAPNVDGARWFARGIWPRILERRPEARLELVGRDPSPVVRRLGGATGVLVTGGVPDVLPYLERARVFVAPVRVGGGFPNKVAEAAAAGLPIVSTRAGHAGIPTLRAGSDALEADDETAFADAVLRLLDDPTLADGLGVSARERMRATGLWSATIDRLEAVLDAAAGARVVQGSLRG